MATIRREICDDNNFIQIIGPIRGRNNAGELVVYDADDVVAVIAANDGETTPIGSLEVTCPKVGTNKYVLFIDGQDVTSELGSLADNTKVWMVVRSLSGQFKTSDVVYYRKNRPSD